MFAKIIVLCISIWSIMPAVTSAQQLIRGTIVDAKSGLALEAATVQIIGTYRGTITNSEGEFELSLSVLPAELNVRFIGYTSQRITLSEIPQFLEIALEPIAVDLSEVVVTGEDPAIEIMREVIRRKPIWRDALNTFEAEAYSRQRLQNDTGIVTITESLSQVYWNKTRGIREVIKSRTQTSNMDPTQNFASATNLPNFYDDNISISGFELVGVTHPNALRYYHFKLEGFRQLDNKTVFDILVTPKRRLQPTFEGMIAVLDEDFALIEVELKPGESVMFPPPIQEFGLAYKQQFSNFGGDYWLPVDVWIDGTIKFGLPGLQFPAITFAQLSRITNYEVNLPSPDSLFSINRRILIDTLSVNYGASESRIALMRVPLDERESLAYATVDSTQTLEKAFRPTGALARFIDSDTDNESRQQGPFSKLLGNAFNGVSPILGYNRVDAGRLGLSYSVPLKGAWRPELSATYTTGSKDWDYMVGSRVNFKNRYIRSLSARYQKATLHTFTHSMFDPIMTSMSTLLSAPDYFNYFKSDGGEVTLRVNPRLGGVMVNVNSGWKGVESMRKVTNYSIPGGSIQRENPEIDGGNDVYMGLTVEYGDQVPFGVVGSETAKMHFQYGSESLGGDFNYIRLFGEVTWRFNTFYKRRFMPNALDVKVVGGTAMGTLPRHLWHGFDSKLSYFGPFGVFKTAGTLPMESTHLAAVHWEHNFRTIPFEALGLMGLARKGISIIVHGSHGVMDTVPGALSEFTRTFDQSQHHEVGASINGLFGLMRFDASRQLNGSGYFLGFSLARLF